MSFVKRSFIYSVFLCGCLFLGACQGPDDVSGGNGGTDGFAGDWQGSGTDSDGNGFTFAAKVIDLGDHKYRLLILDALDTQEDPMHVMDGELKNNKFTYTADGGTYVGEGELKDELFEGFYKGPVDGTYTMWRIK